MVRWYLARILWNYRSRGFQIFTWLMKKPKWIPHDELPSLCRVTWAGWVIADWMSEAPHPSTILVGRCFNSKGWASSPLIYNFKGDPHTPRLRWMSAATKDIPRGFHYLAYCDTAHYLTRQQRGGRATPDSGWGKSLADGRDCGYDRHKGTDRAVGDWRLCMHIVGGTVIWGGISGEKRLFHNN